jgi:hypothetical protein
VLENSGYIKTFVETMEAEFKRLVPEEHNIVYGHLVTQLNTLNYNNMFSLNELSNTVERVFGNGHIRDFIFNLDFRFKVNLSLLGITDVYIGSILKEALYKARADSLVPLVVSNSLETVHNVERVLADNSWLSVYLMTVLYIQYINEETPNDTPEKHPV